MKRLTILSFLFVSFYSYVKQDFERDQMPENKFYNKAYEFRDLNPDSALKYFDLAKAQFLKQKDSLRAGKCMVNLAMIATAKGDYFGGQELSLKAVDFFNKANPNHHPYLRSNYNNLAIATYRLKDYERSLTFYDLAIKFAVYPRDVRTCENNKGNSYRELGDYAKALLYYGKSLKGDISAQEYARALTNLAFTKWLQKPKYNAAPELLKALQIREEANDYLAQNSSYAHLSDYYRDKRTDSALFFAQQMLHAASASNSPDDRLVALDKLIRLSPLKDIKSYFQQYRQLSDSLETARNAAKNQFILILHEVEESEQKYLVLQKDNAEKQYQITKREALLAGAVLLFVAAAIIITLWYKKRKQKLESAAQNAIRSSQLKTSKKVHDVVANGIYRAMSEIENQDEIDRERILDVLEDVYEKSRNISYEVEPAINSSQDFDERVERLAKSFRTSQTVIQVEGNTKALWLNVSKTVREEIEHVLQELLVNMKKHSRANDVGLRFELVENRLHLSYVDNGIGISGEINFNNGLANTVNRIKAISGVITFDTTVEKGVKILISVPVS